MKPVNYKNKTAMVITVKGINVTHAIRLARDFGRVFVVCDFSGDYTTDSIQSLHGLGFPNITVVNTIFCKEFNDIDLFYFPEESNGAVQLYLQSIGKRVWGARNGDELELDRVHCKRVMEKLGLPVNPWKSFDNLAELEKHLASGKDHWVKINRWRGDFESFKVTTVENNQKRLARLRNRFGPLERHATFIVEEEIHGQETGVDTYIIDGKTPDKTVMGFELKGKGYVSFFSDWDDLPDPEKLFYRKMSPVFKRYGYRGWFSDEMIITKNGDGFMIDACCRAPSPPSDLCLEQYTNWTDIVWYGAEGIMVQPKACGLVGLEMRIFRNSAKAGYTPVEMEGPSWAWTDHIKPISAVMGVKGDLHIGPITWGLMGSLVATGDTLDKCEVQIRRTIDTMKSPLIDKPYHHKLLDRLLKEAKARIEGLHLLGRWPLGLGLIQSKGKKAKDKLNGGLLG